MKAYAWLIACIVAGCSHAGGKLAVDTPVLPYQAPDISEITGIDEDEEPKTEPPKAEPAKNDSPPATMKPASTPAPAPTPVKK